MKSYDYFNKNVNLPPPENKNELKYLKPDFLSINSLLTEFKYSY